MLTAVCELLLCGFFSEFYNWVWEDDLHVFLCFLSYPTQFPHSKSVANRMKNGFHGFVWVFLGRVGFDLFFMKGQVIILYSPSSLKLYVWFVCELCCFVLWRSKFRA